MENLSSVLYHYFKGLETGNLEMIADAFAENAVIHSPLYGDASAKEFYIKILSDAPQSDIAILNVFTGMEDINSAAVHFKYHLILNGTQSYFECVDIFKFDEAGKIKDMTIIYDTAALRAEIERLS